MESASASSSVLGRSSSSPATSQAPSGCSSLAMVDGSRRAVVSCYAHDLSAEELHAKEVEACQPSDSGYRIVVIDRFQMPDGGEIPTGTAKGEVGIRTDGLLSSADCQEALRPE